jgi:excisionase family DNA binding protein
MTTQEYMNHETTTGTPHDRELLKRHELALLLRCTVRTVANLTKRGAIPVLKVGRHNRYNRGAVLAALERAGRQQVMEVV